MSARAEAKYTVIRTGKPRDVSPRSPGWHVRIYLDKATGQYYVKFKNTERKNSWPKWRANSLEAAEALFEQIEAALDAGTKLATVTPTGANRDIDALVVGYLAKLDAVPDGEQYYWKVRDICQTWIANFVLPEDLPGALPLAGGGTRFGALPVREWTPAHSEVIIAAARREVGPNRVEDIGVALSGLIKQAKRPEVAWLPPTTNPLQGVKYTAKSHQQGRPLGYVEPRKRPTDGMVRAVRLAAEARAHTLGVSWLPLLIAVACLCGLRWGEQMALRAIDIDLEAREILVNGSWRPKRYGVPGKRKSVKNKMLRAVAYQDSLHTMFVRACAVALGLPPDAPEARVIAAQRAERDRRTRLAAGSKPRRARGEARGGNVTAAPPSATGWHDVPMPVAEECWIFPNPLPAAQDGVQWTREQWNGQWKHLRRMTEKWAVDGSWPTDDSQLEAWPASIKYMNARHHAVGWWRANLKDEKSPDEPLSWEAVADMLGDKVYTVLEHYVLKSEDTARSIASQMRRH